MKFSSRGIPNENHVLNPVVDAASEKLTGGGKGDIPYPRRRFFANEVGQFENKPCFCRKLTAAEKQGNGCGYLSRTDSRLRPKHANETSQTHNSVLVSPAADSLIHERNQIDGILTNLKDQNKISVWNGVIVVLEFAGPGPVRSE